MPGMVGLGRQWVPVLQCTRCLRSLPTADAGAKVEFHLGTCRFWPTTEEVRRTRVALGPDAMPPMPPRLTDPTTTSAGPSPNSGRGSLPTCGDVGPNPGLGQTEEAGVPRQVLPLDIALTAPCIRGHIALHPDAPGQALWWCVRCGMSWRAPDGCAPTAGPSRRDHQSWLRHRQLVISKRSPEYQALRRALRIDTGTSIPRIHDPCVGRRWNPQYYTWRRLLHRLVVHSPCPPGSDVPGRRIHGQCVLPRAAGVPLLRQGASLLSCGDVEAHPGPPPPDWGEEDYAVLPDLVQEACSRLGIAPVREAFATPTNRRSPALWTKAEDAFSQAWEDPNAGALWENPPFSRLDEVVTKASRE